MLTNLKKKNTIYITYLKIINMFLVELFWMDLINYKMIPVVQS